MDQKYTNFGFKKVPFLNKAKLVDGVFSSVASKYDLMNDLMSFGIHRLWKSEFLKLLPDKSKSLLDVACGSGDISASYLKEAKNHSQNPSVVLCDINQEMLKEARNKFINSGLIPNATLLQGDATSLPISENSFDYYSIAFGIRNVNDIPKALKEAYRVLLPGGKFVCMEFAPFNEGALGKLYSLYSFNIIPKLGGFITKNEEAYQYLVESISEFPKTLNFINMMQAAGFGNIVHKDLTFGVASIYCGYKT